VQGEKNWTKGRGIDGGTGEELGNGGIKKLLECLKVGDMATLQQRDVHGKKGRGTDHCKNGKLPLVGLKPIHDE